LYDVLGEEGYRLHRELQELDFSLSKIDPDRTTYFLDEIITQMQSSVHNAPEADPLFAKLSSSPSPSDLSMQKPSSDAEVDGAEKKRNMSKDFSTIESSSSKSPVKFNALAEMDTPKSTKNLKSAHSVYGDPSLEDRDTLFAEIEQQAAKIPKGDLILAMLEHGSRRASEKPRDVATFYCLYGLFTYIVDQDGGRSISKLSFGVTNSTDVIEHAKRCLLRCLTISNQAISTGMMGWLEYGDSSPFDRLTQRPFAVLRELSYVFVRLGNWTDAECVIRALVSRCEQHLPLYHPTTLTALLDLAVATAMTGNRAFSEHTLSRVAGSLSAYLSEMESGYFRYLSRCRAGNKPGENAFRIEQGRDFIFMLEAFVSLFQMDLNREIFRLVDRENSILLANHCFLADALSILANCKAAARSVLGVSSGTKSENGLLNWQLAYGHYQHGFTGFSKTKPLDDVDVIKASYGLARCLRELGETEKALELLTLVVSFTVRNSHSAKKNETEKRSANTAEQTKKSELGFLSQSLCRRCGCDEDKVRASKLISSALCLWLMAILSLETSPNEEGRERSFGFLHAASVSLQSALNAVSEADDETMRATCVQYLGIIEEEALQIAEPIYE
jgi:hypothetical protein